MDSQIGYIALLIVGFVVLIGGGEFLVRGAVSLAVRFKLSPTVIGLTVVALGTSLPELAVSTEATLEGKSHIALNNVIGSNIINIGIVLALSAAIKPILSEPRHVKKDWPLLAISTSALLGFAYLNMLNWIAGITFIAMLIYFLYASLTSEDAVPEDAEHELEELEKSVGFKKLLLSAKPYFYLLIGFPGLIYGGQIVVDNSVSLAQNYGVPEAIISVTVIALGTSLPELTASLISIFKGGDKLAIGGIIGSNIFNILAIISTSSFITTITVSESDLTQRLPVMGLIAFILLPILYFFKGIPRLAGAVIFISTSAWYYVMTTQGINPN